MDPISNVDRFVRQLKAKLEERNKVRGVASTASAAKIKAVHPRGAAGVQAIATEFVRAGLDDTQLRRSLVEQLLADQFGPTLINEAKFQQIVDRVNDIMAADVGIGELLNQVMGELRTVE
jgi:uncharacterized protein YoaH (UPF0181 family)